MFFVGRAATKRSNQIFFLGGGAGSANKKTNPCTGSELKRHPRQLALIGKLKETSNPCSARFLPPEIGESLQEPFRPLIWGNNHMELPNCFPKHLYRGKTSAVKRPLPCIALVPTYSHNVCWGTPSIHCLGHPVLEVRIS